LEFFLVFAGQRNSALTKSKRVRFWARNKKILKIFNTKKTSSLFFSFYSLFPRYFFRDCRCKQTVLINHMMFKYETPFCILSYNYSLNMTKGPSNRVRALTKSLICKKLDESEALCISPTLIQDFALVKILQNLQQLFSYHSVSILLF